MARASNIERLGAAEAMLRARGNELRRYPSPERDGERLYPLASPTANPSFTIEADDTIYAIGSCFARNVERALEEAGKRVLSREFELGDVGESLGDAANFFNKYSIHSVTNEIRWALERDTFPGEDVIYPMGKGRYCDPQLGMARLDFPMEKILEFRHRYLDAVASVAEADVIILTLGYVETWYDRKLDLYLNVIPPAPVIKAEPDRFEFRVLSYRDVLDGLNELYDLLVRHRTKPLKMLVTVSPVPLLATFRDMDVLLANAYSKSVQRAALDEFLLDKEGVDYFPSYEFVTLSNPTIAWSRNDFRHVSSDVVKRIMSNVITRYIGGDAEAPLTAENEITKDGLVSSLKLLHKLEKFDDVLVMVEQHRELADSCEDVLMLEATAARRLDDLDHSFVALKKASQVAPRKPQALERMIMLCRPMRRAEDARALLGLHEKAFPGRSDFRQRVTWI